MTTKINLTNFFYTMKILSENFETLYTHALNIAIQAAAVFNSACLFEATAQNFSAVTLLSHG